MNTPLINVLLITYYFPPKNHIASFRNEAIVKYLNSSRYCVHVLTVGPEGVEGLTDLGGTIVSVASRGAFKFDTHKRSIWFVHKFKALLNRIIQLVSSGRDSGWEAQALEVARNLIEQHGVRVVITSYAPVSALMVGMALKQANPSLVWLSDMRDELSENDRIPWVRRYRLRKIEQAMLACADVVTSVSEPILADFRQNSGRPNQLFGEIRNGYDFDLIKSMPSRQGAVLRIAYAGTFYGERKPANLFVAMERLSNQVGGVELTIFGGNSGIRIPAGLRGRVTFVERVSHEDMIARLSRFDAFLLLHPTSRRKGIFTGKIFEYLAINRPILALVDPTDCAAELILKAEAGYVAPNEDVEQIFQALSQLYVDWSEGNLKDRNWPLIAAHSRAAQIGIMEQLVKEALVIAQAGKCRATLCAGDVRE